jgi:hypothetical protein
MNATRQWPRAAASPPHQPNKLRLMSSNGSDSSKSWSKKQIEKIERKFQNPSSDVEREEDLQQMWREMESRVTNRRPRTLRETGGKTGRVNVRKTDEEMWLREGMYEKDEDERKR